MKTTTAASPEARERLRFPGEKGEGNDDIPKELIDRSAWDALDRRWNTILKDHEFIPLDEL